MEGFHRSPAKNLSLSINHLHCPKGAFGGGCCLYPESLFPLMNFPTWEEILTFVKTLGWTKGVFTIFFFMMHGWVFSLYRGRLVDRQGEINRLAEDNRAYRDRYLHVLDKHYGITSGQGRRK